ncbi:MAG: alpha/beta hydrolase, partial [Actinomycetota bacterium]|nr:alpha/beta hydrolase [Actinomycetota bacterium]
MPHVEGAGVALHYEERGDGRPLLVIHAMASGAAQWSAALDELAQAGARAVAYDRRGYGSSGAPQPYAATTVQEQSEDAAALIAALGLAPALLVGDGFGALVALELLVRRPELAAGAVLAEPPLYAYVAAATEALAAERQALEEALREG